MTNQHGPALGRLTPPLDPPPHIAWAQPICVERATSRKCLHSWPLPQPNSHSHQRRHAVHRKTRRSPANLSFTKNHPTPKHRIACIFHVASNTAAVRTRMLASSCHAGAAPAYYYYTHTPARHCTVGTLLSQRRADELAARRHALPSKAFVTLATLAARPHHRIIYLITDSSEYYRPWLGSGATAGGGRWQDLTLCSRSPSA